MDDIMSVNADEEMFTDDETLFKDANSADRKGMYQVVAERFNIRSALYPGCGLDISPSLFIPKVVYLDFSPESSAFFDKRNIILDYIAAQKTYPESCEITFYATDYFTPPELPQFDLLVSQFAGNVGQEMKRFLKPGGVLLVAEGPADFSLALYDPDYELLGTVLWEPGRTKFLPGIQGPVYVPYEELDFEEPDFEEPDFEEPDFEDDDDDDGMQTLLVPLTRNFCFRKKQADCEKG